MTVRTRKYLQRKKWDKQLRWKEKYIADHPDEWISQNRKPYVVLERMMYNQLLEINRGVYKPPINEKWEYGQPELKRVQEMHIDENGQWYGTIRLEEINN